jgi:hypothetical protein
MIAGEYVTDWPLKGSLTPIDIVADVIGLTEMETRKCCNVVMIEEPIMEQYAQPDIDTIIGTVCNRFKLDPALVHFKTRRREVVEPRQLIHALLVFGLGITTGSTGQLVGKLDHATVLHGISKVSERYSTYADYRKTINNLIRTLWADPDKQQHIIDRITDPLKERRSVTVKFTPTLHRTPQVERSVSV